MVSEIMSVFENTDTAELALSRLRAIGIPLISYQIRLFSGRDTSDNAYSYPATNAINPVDNAAFMNNTFMLAPAFIPAGQGNADGWREKPSEEVALHLLVEESNVVRVKSALISSHGRKVSELQRVLNR